VIFFEPPVALRGLRLLFEAIRPNTQGTVSGQLPVTIRSICLAGGQQENRATPVRLPNFEALMEAARQGKIVDIYGPQQLSPIGTYSHLFTRVSLPGV
jgi:hypothetical protein